MAADLSGFKTYAEWQAANRAAGGPGESAEVRAQFLNNGGNAPAQAAPAQPIHNVYSAQGGTEITDQNRQTANMTADQRAAWAAQNLNSFDAQSRQGAGGPGMSSQQAFDQWKAWDDKYDSSCPPNMPYRGRNGQCDESPDNCPAGTTLHGSTCISNEQANQLFGGGYGGQPQGGQGQAAGGPAAPGLDPNDPNSALQQQMVRMYQEGGQQFGTQAFGQELGAGGMWAQDATQPAVNPALAQAALTAFTPAAPSQNQGAPAPAPSAPAPGPSNTSTFNPAQAQQSLQNATNNSFSTPPAAQAPAGGGALEQSLQNQYRNVNKWWADDANRPQVA